MPNLYFNKLGYYVLGDGIEIARSCPPLTFKGDGKPLLEPIHHLYAVLLAALIELRGYDTKEDVNVYNDSRIIEEMQGESPLDATCAESMRYLKRHVIPLLSGTVWFRKKAGDWVEAKVRSGHQKMIEVVDVGTRDRQAERVAELLEAKKRSRSRDRIMDLKQRWRHKPDA